MANCMEEFSTWLGAKLQDLNIDETIFGSYIQGILEGDEPVEEKTEGLQGILSAIIADANEITKLCDEILEKWQLYKSNDPSPTEVGEDLDSKLARLLKSQLPAATAPCSREDEEKSKDKNAEKEKLKKSILMQYGQMSDDEDEEGDSNSKNSAVPHSAGGATGGGSDHKEGRVVLEKNTNAQSVMQAEKEKREQARLDSQKKKEKDKEDREKQKQLRDDKKEKRKTQKQERKR